jgi:hypothetical protein
MERLGLSRQEALNRFWLVDDKVGVTKLELSIDIHGWC